MADHFVSLFRGEEGFKYSDFTTGTASTAGDDMDFRVRDGAGLTIKDVINALHALERFFENPQQVAPAGFDVKL